jgi:hypothetical protein
MHMQIARALAAKLFTLGTTGVTGSLVAGVLAAVGIAGAGGLTALGIAGSALGIAGAGILAALGIAGSALRFNFGKARKLVSLCRRACGAPRAPRSREANVEIKLIVVVAIVQVHAVHLPNCVDSISSAPGRSRSCRRPTQKARSLCQ